MPHHSLIKVKRTMSLGFLNLENIRTLQKKGRELAYLANGNMCCSVAPLGMDHLGISRVTQQWVIALSDSLAYCYYNE